MKAICSDLRAECDDLDKIVADLDEKEWLTMTPSPGWNIKDQIFHLAYGDDRARLAVTDPKAFGRRLEEVMQDIEGFFKELQKVGSDMSLAELLNWWREERTAMVNVFEQMDAKTRVPWYGPPMSVRSKATARLMETWAHGQDVADALRIRRTPTDRLRHVAHIGVTTYKWSFVNRGLDPLETLIRVELNAPSGELWEWGPSEAAESIRGAAEDFCLVVTQRRHMYDTGLVVTGKDAIKWMANAQAFAGPPTDGPPAGERVLIKT